MASKMNDKTTISQQNAKILFTGGGTGGHVYPNLALVPEFDKEDLKQRTQAAKATPSKEGSLAPRA